MSLRLLFNLNKRLKYLLKSIDIFGHKTELKMNRHSKFKTTIGGCFTLIMIITCLLLFLSFGSDMLYHENPSSYISERFTANPSRTNFSKESYFFMFGVQDSNFQHFIDESFYTVSVFNRKWGKNNDSFAREAAVERCSEEILPQNPTLREYFKGASGAPLNQLYCVKDLDNYFIEGSFDAEEYTFLDISINSCQNSSNNTTCKSQGDIADMMSGFFAFYTTDYLIDPQRFSDPGQPVGKDYFTPLSLGIKRYTNRFIADTKINSDDGFLFEDITHHQYPSYSFDKESLVMNPANEGQLLYFLIRKAHDEIIYERSYKKLQNTLAEIGGLIQVLYLLFFGLSYPSISKQYFEKITNTIYNFEDGMENMSKSIAHQKDNYKLSNANISNESPILEIRSTEKINQRNMEFSKVFDRIMVQSNGSQSVALNFLKPGTKPRVSGIAPKFNNKDFLKSLIKLQKHHPLKTTFFEFIKINIYHFWQKFSGSNSMEKSKVFVQSTEKLTRLQTATFAIKEKLDGAYILKKFYELDKLKILLLNEDQYHLFEFASKPMVLKNGNIHIGNKKKSFLVSYENDLIMDKTKKMY